MHPGSASGASRIDAVDLARAIALLGMMVVHLGPYWSDDRPPVGDLIAAGRAAPLFALLAGVALSLVQHRDPDGVGSVRATVVRGAVLTVLGLALGSIPDMPVLVILAFYGLMIVVALPFRQLSTRALLIVGGVWSVVAPLVLLWLQIQSGPRYTEQAAASDLLPPWHLATELIVWGAYPAGVWFAYVLIGLAVGRLDLTRLRVGMWLSAVGAGLVAGTLGIGWTAIARGWTPGDDGRWRQLFGPSRYPTGPASWRDLWLVGEHTSRPLNVVGAIGSALLIVGLCALLMRLSAVRMLSAPLRAAGAMTLTLYTVHVLWTWRAKADVMAGLESGADWGGYERWLVQVVVLCTFAWLWQRLVGRGPLESGVRWLSVDMKNAPVDDRGVESVG